MSNMSKKQIPDMSLSVIVNPVRRYVIDPHLTCVKLLTRKQKTPTDGASAERIRLPSIWQHMQKTSPTAGASAERIRLPGALQLQSRNQAKYHQHLQLQLRRQGVLSGVGNGSRPWLRVQVWVRTEPLPNWLSGSSIHLDYQFGYSLMEVSQPV